MAVTIGELRSEVIAEPDERAGAAVGATTERAASPGVVRAELVAIGRRAMRTRAEGFDD